MHDIVSVIRRYGVLLVAAVAAYVPIVASSPGVVGADTKTYLYLDPGRVLSNAASLWDSDVALGTVTHQNIGYLWPMGPFYWLMETLGSPDWFAQRIWLGSLLFAAGAGVWFLLRTLDWRGPGMLIAVLAYEMSPYLLDYSARISAVLLPWAGLPWMLAFTIRAARSDRWRDPALFALVVLTVGSVNATSLLLVGLAPVAWLFHARFADRSITTGEGVRAALRIGVLTVAVSVWWIAGLALQGGYSLPVTRYTETYQTVASASTAPEVFRGLGYWFFYGNDKFGPWIQPSIEYTQGVWLLFIGFGLVVLSLLGAGLVRWRHRSFFVLLIVLGGLIAVGGQPFDAPSPLGSIFKDFTSTDAGLALRSTPRALPMLVLATSVLLAALVNALSERWPDPTRVFAVLVLAAVVLNNPAMWRVRMIEEHLQRDEELPEYWLEAIDWLDANGNDGRVMELPGSDFASYRWGNTVDPITPGFLDRGYVARELVPFGSPESAALLTAFDRRFQEDSVDADSIIPIAQLMSVDDIVHRADLTYERFRTPRPVPTADLFENYAGLEPGTAFGDPVPNVAGPQQTMLDEVELAIDPRLPDPAPVTAYPVPDALDVVRTRTVAGPTIVVGDADGIVDAAGAGLIDPDRTLWFGADLLLDADLRAEVLGEPASVVITDSNKRRARRWGTLRENLGYVEQAGEDPLRDDPTDNRLELFPDIEASETIDADDTRTVSVRPGPYTLRASNYGNPVTYTNDDRPAYATDGDPTTAWVVGAFAEARGEWLEFRFDSPTQVPHLTLVQPQVPENRSITEVTIRADGRELVVAALDDASRTVEGQRIDLPDHSAATVYEVELSDLDFPIQPSYDGVSPVGFAEVRLGDLAPVTERLRTPIAFVDAVGADLDDHAVSVVLTRERSNPQEPVRAQPEREIRREVALAGPRTFTVAGAARLASAAPEWLIDTLIGRVGAADGRRLLARSSGRLPGDLRSAASFAIDGDPTTAWTGTFGGQAGQWVEFGTDGVRSSALAVTFVADDRHSVPTFVRLHVDGVPVGDFPTGLQLGAGTGTTATVTIPAIIAGSTVRLEILDVVARDTQDWYSSRPVTMPVAIAEVDFGTGLAFGSPAAVSTTCLDIAQVDGEPLTARIVGSAEDALERRELSIEGCAPVMSGADGVTVDTVGQGLGFDIDQIVLSSPREIAAPTPAGPVVVEDHDDTYYRLTVPASEVDRFLVLGQSHNDGWAASVEGQSLGEPLVIDGFANGWLLPASGEVEVVLDWEPQSLVARSLWFSAIAVVLTLGLALLGGGARRAPLAYRADGPEQPRLRLLPGIDPHRVVTVAGWATTALAATFVATFSYLNLPRMPALAVAVGAAVALALRQRTTITRPALLAGIGLGLVALQIMVEQRRFRYPPGFGWPEQFADLHVYGVICLLLLAADYVVSIVRPEGREPDDG